MPTGRGFDLFGGAKIKSVQRGVTLLQRDETQLDIAITPVDLSKTFVLIHYKSVPGLSPSDSLCRAELVSDSTLRLTRYTGAISINVVWQVVEFEAGVEVQQLTATLNTRLETSLDIAPIDVGRAFAVISNESFETTMSGLDDSDVLGCIAQVTGLTTTSVQVQLYNSKHGRVTVFVVEVTG